MEVINLHADRSQLAVVRSHELQWLPSPLAGVDRRPLERLARLGLLGPRLISVHSVHLEDPEIDALARHGITTLRGK